MTARMMRLSLRIACNTISHSKAADKQREVAVENIIKIQNNRSFLNIFKNILWSKHFLNASFPFSFHLLRSGAKVGIFCMILNNMHVT